MSPSSLRRTPVVLGVAILFLALGTAGGAAAGALVTSADIKDGTIRNQDLRADTIKSSRIAETAVKASELGTTTLVTQQETILANNNKTATATCPSGSQILSGGGSSTSYGVYLVSSFQSGNGWIIAAHSTSGSDQTITAVAICLNPSAAPAKVADHRVINGDARTPPRVVQGR